MEFKHIRGSILILFDKITELPLLIAAAIVSIFIVKNFDPQVVTPIFIIALSPLGKLIQYISTFYTVADGHLIVETGLWRKKRTEIPLRQITTVDLSQNILYQLTKTYKIKVDNASQTIDTVDQAEIRLALKAEKALAFKQAIIQNNAPEITDEDNRTVITASLRDFLKLGLLQSKTVYVISGLPVAVPIITAAAVKIGGYQSTDDLFNHVFSHFLDPLAWGLGLFSFIVSFYGIALAISLLKAVITYYNYRISENREILKIEYGLLNKKKYTFHKNKISGVLFKQNLLMRLFHCYTATIMVIGYGDKSDEQALEQAIFYPIASLPKMKNILQALLPDYIVEESLQKPTSKARRYFFYRPGFIIAVLIFMGALVAGSLGSIILISVPASVLLGIAGVSVLLQYGNTGISCRDNTINLSYGGYHKTIAVIKTARIESITALGSVLKRKKGIVSINIGITAPLREANLKVLNLPAEQYYLLARVMKY
ncbi:PH domain-containing protein [Dehalobacter sp. DCM]|uniref:PH domain-containing protein n=1 Tax=Dehalobacter sp. DCM TaxID=2907827 RepID=UPI003081E918|nr:PH domain-containing protein [Dehalobacter sp. DCM]